MKNFFKRKSSRAQLPAGVQLANNDGKVNENDNSSTDLPSNLENGFSLSIQPPPNSSSTSMVSPRNGSQNPASSIISPRNGGSKNNQLSYSVPPINKSITPQNQQITFKKQQPQHVISLQLEDLLATSYKQRTGEQKTPLKRFLFLVDFSLMDSTDLYNIVKRGFIHYIHAKSNSSWNISDFGTTTFNSIVTLTIMGINQSAVMPLWNSENDMLLQSHYISGQKGEPSTYVLTQRNIIDCCEFLNNNSNFTIESNPYEENEDVINLDALGQYLLSNMTISDINILTSYVEKQTRVSISTTLLLQIEKMNAASEKAFNIDSVKFTPMAELGILSGYNHSNQQSSVPTISNNQRTEFENLEQFVNRIRRNRNDNTDFTFCLGLGKSDVVRTNKDLELGASKTFSLCTVNPLLRKYSISFDDEIKLSNPLTDYIYHI